MPDKPKSDSPPVPAGRAGQHANLVRLAIVVGLPLLSVVLRLPIWFTLLLLCVLAAVLFFRPRLPEKSQPDPKQAWTLLMTNFVRLQSIYDALKKSPYDAEARRRFSMIEARCLSILNGRPDSDWGPDSQYAVKTRNEIAAMSASVRDNEMAGLVPASEGTAFRLDASPSPAAKPDVPVPVEKQGLTPANEGTAPQPDTPAPPAKPEVPITAEKQGLTPASEAAAPQPASPVPSSKADVPTPVEKQDLTPASDVTTPQLDSPSLPAKPEVPTSAEKQGLTSASEATAVQPESPVASAKLDVPAPAKEQGVISKSEGTRVQSESPAPPARPEIPTPPGTQRPTPASESTALQPVSPAAPAKLAVAGPSGRRLTPYLWLPGGVEDAAAFYVSVFRNSRIVSISRYPEGLHAEAWSVLTATVCLDGQDLMLLNGGSVHNLPRSFQLLVRCADQAEVDYYWERLLAGGGEESAGGWLKDRFGVSWQVMPDALLELLNDPNPQRAARATEAMLKMKKIDIATLREAVGQPEAIVSSPPG